MRDRAVRSVSRPSPLTGPTPAPPTHPASRWLAFALLAVALVLGHQGPCRAQTLPDDIDISGAPNGVVALPATVDPVFTDIFDRYTKIVAPNGQAIHLLIEDQVTDEMAVRAREVMRFYLTDVPGSQYGTDKTTIANSMANLEATLVYFNTEQSAQQALAGPLGKADFFGQDLYASESVVEGTAAYFDNSNRDATFEEVFHLVHGAGIEPTLPAFHAEMTTAKDAAKAIGDWTPPPGLPVQDEVFEYIISVIDVYYGYWAHDPDGNGTSFGGEYAFHTRAGVIAGDPLGVTAMRKFLPEFFTADLLCTAGFAGTFELSFDPGQEYTHKSQYLDDLGLSGPNPSNLVGNARDNLLVGNSGDNQLDGRDGTDTVRFRGPRAEYTLTDQGGSVVVLDTVGGRDGTDTLIAIERLEFTDQTVHLGALVFADGFESGDSSAWSGTTP